MAISITRCISVITLSLVCFSSFAWAKHISHGLYAEHDKPVYLAALISNKPIRNAPVNKSQLLQSEMQILFQRDYSIRQIVRHIGSWALIGNKTNPEYANALDADSLAAIYRLNKQLFEANNKASLGLGDVLVLTNTTAQTQISLNGQIISTVNDPAFYYYLANMWLGESVASKRFQQQLFSTKPDLAALYQQQTQGKSMVASAPEPAAQTQTEQKTTQAAVITAAKPQATIATPVSKPAVATNTTQAAAVTTTAAVSNKPKAAINKPKATTKAPKPKSKPEPATISAKPSSQQPKKLAKPSYEPLQQSFEQAQKSNYQRLLLAINSASFPIEKQAIDAVILFTDQNGQVINAQVVSKSLKDTELLSKKMAFISQDISPIVTAKDMQQPGIYAFKVNFKP